MFRSIIYRVTKSTITFTEIQKWFGSDRFACENLCFDSLTNKVSEEMWKIIWKGFCMFEVNVYRMCVRRNAQRRLLINIYYITWFDANLTLYISMREKNGYRRSCVKKWARKPCRAHWLIMYMLTLNTATITTHMQIHWTPNWSIQTVSCVRQQEQQTHSKPYL